MNRFNHDMDGSMEPAEDGRWALADDANAEITRLRSVNAQLLETLAYFVDKFRYVDDTGPSHEGWQSAELAAKIAAADAAIAAAVAK